MVGHLSAAAIVGESQGTPPSETSEPPDCWPKLNSAGKFNSKRAVTSIQFTSPPNLIEWFPIAQFTLSRIWKRFSTRATGEKGFEPMKRRTRCPLCPECRCAKSRFGRAFGSAIHLEYR